MRKVRQAARHAFVYLLISPLSPYLLPVSAPVQSERSKMVGLASLGPPYAARPTLVGEQKLAQHGLGVKTEGVFPPA